MKNELNRALGLDGERYLTAYETEAVFGDKIGETVAAAYHWIANKLGIISAATRRVGPAL